MIYERPEAYNKNRRRRERTWWNDTDVDIATLVFDSRSSADSVGYRGTGGRFGHSFDDELPTAASQDEPTKDGDDGAAKKRSWHFMGQVDAKPPPPRFSVSLVGQGHSLPSAEWVADERGASGLTVPPGRYDLFVRHGETTMVVPNIEIR